MEDRCVIKSVWGTFWNEDMKGWTVYQNATYFEMDGRIYPSWPHYLTWMGPEGEEEMEYDTDSGCFYTGDDPEPTAWIEDV